MFVAVFVRPTSTPGITAPLASVTVPRTTPDEEVCAFTRAHNKNSAKKSAPAAAHRAIRLLLNGSAARRDILTSLCEGVRFSAVRVGESSTAQLEFTPVQAAH